MAPRWRGRGTGPALPRANSSSPFVLGRSAPCQVCHPAICSQRRAAGTRAVNAGRSGPSSRVNDSTCRCFLGTERGACSWELEPCKPGGSEAGGAALRGTLEVWECARAPGDALAPAGISTGRMREAPAHSRGPEDEDASVECCLLSPSFPSLKQVISLVSPKGSFIFGMYF